MKNLKQRAVDLRQRGWSYNVISQRLGVAKSTLSHWLREIPYEPNRTIIQRIRLGPARAAVTKQQRRLAQIELLRAEGRRQLGKLSSRDLLFLGLGLYLGEGTKVYEEVRVINADPQVVKVMMRWLRSACAVPDKNFSIAVHAYPDVSPQRAIGYWAGVTGVPRRQFERVQIDRRLDKSMKKQRRLPYGTAHIRVYSRGDARFGVALHRRIMGWVDAAFRSLRA